MINEKTIKPFLNLLSNEQIGKVIREFINPSEISLNEIERVLLIYLNEKKINYSKGALKGWKTKKQQKEQTQKRDLPQTNFKKPIYNNYKPSQNTQQTQKDKDFIKEYQSRGVLKL